MTERTLDELMDLDPLGLSDQDLDSIIAYQRKMRQQFEGGVKPKKAKGQSADLTNVIAALTNTPPEEEKKPVDRRF